MKYKIKEYLNERKYKFWSPWVNLKLAQSPLALQLNHFTNYNHIVAGVHCL